MDFLKIFRSLEEFLYEVMTWLVFYPRTMWRVVTGPLKMVVYARQETDTKSDNAFADAVSPPLFLMLTIGLTHLVEIATHHDVSGIGNTVGHAIFGNEQNLLIYRSIAFSIWPLVFSVGMLRRTKTPLNRETLRGPFFVQCFLTAPFTLILGLGTLMIITSGLSSVAGACLIIFSFAWYFVTQTRWAQFRLNCRYGRAAGVMLLDFLTGLLINLTVAYLMAI